MPAVADRFAPKCLPVRVLRHRSMVAPKLPYEMACAPPPIPLSASSYRCGWYCPRAARRARSTDRPWRCSATLFLPEVLRAPRLPRRPSATRVIGTAEEYIGVPYKWGGNTPESGFDCSGYTRYVFARQGVQLPRTSREQARAGQNVTARRSALRQGDLMMFAEPHRAISHVAIYAGDGRIIHSSSSGGGVRYDDLDTKRGQWFMHNMVAARRLTANGRSLVQALELLTQPNSPLDPPDRAPRP